MSEQTAKTYRVAQWATGNIGTHAMRAVIEHPHMELVGLWVHTESKVGKDAGEICGLGRTVGVKATHNIEDILAQKPDCVLYMPQYLNLDEVCRLLESGINIVTSVVEFHDTHGLSPDVRARVEEACRRGGTSIHSTGSSPGFITAALPFALTTLVRRLDCYTIDEYADVSSRDSPGMVFDVMGFGKKPTVVDERHVDHIRHSFGQALRHTAAALSIPIERVEATGEVGTARNRVQIAAGVLEAGTVAALRFTVTAYRGDKPALRFRANWYCTKDIEQKDWNLGDTGWRVRVEGDPPLDVRISFPCAPAEWAQTSPGLTAYPVVNAVPAVCAAAPGIRSAADLRIFSVLG
jgi:2,4-diaminopentanoate dehydrogenase